MKQGFYDKHYFEFPNIINVEVFRGLCPCKCVHCPVGQINVSERSERFGVEEIPLELFNSIVDEVSKYPQKTIRLHSVGEPLLWKDLRNAVAYTRNKNIITWLFTSLVTTDFELLKHLCDNVNIIEVSINSADAKDYLETKGIDAFNLVYENLSKMSNYIKENNLSTRLIVSRVQSESELTDDKFVEYWKNTKLASDVFVRKFHSYNDLLSNKFEMPKVKQACLVHFMRFNISCKGLVVSCFNELFKKDLRDDVILGSLYDSSIAEIWHNEKLENIRNAELKGYDLYNHIFTPDFPCRNCFSCQPYDGKNITSEHQIEKLTE